MCVYTRACMRGVRVCVVVPQECRRPWRPERMVGLLDLELQQLDLQEQYVVVFTTEPYSCRIVHHFCNFGPWNVDIIGITEVNGQRICLYPLIFPRFTQGYVRLFHLISNCDKCDCFSTKGKAGDQPISFISRYSGCGWETVCCWREGVVVREWFSMVIAGGHMSLHMWQNYWS